MIILVGIIAYLAGLATAFIILNWIIKSEQPSDLHHVGEDGHIMEG